MTSANEVACFGELLWDLFDTTAADAKSGTARTYRREVGGASANVATVLARLGIRTAVIGAVGSDEFGDTLCAELEASSVDVSRVVRLEGVRTGLTFVSRDATGEPSFVPYRVGTADMALSPAHVLPAMAKVRYAVVSSTSMLPSLCEATSKFLDALEKHKGTLVVDLNVRPHLWADAEAMRAAVAELAGRAAVVKGSESDLAALAGKRGMSWLERHAKGATWVLTRGENGAACVGPHGQVTFPTKRVRCVDATGAGDAFVAGLLAVLVRSGAKAGTPAFAEPKLWSRGMEVGHILGAKAVSALGATTGVRSLDDLCQRLDPPTP
jgi:fructokinase